MSPPVVLVSSTVVGIQELLDRVYGLLTSFGYEVWMSHKGTVPVRSDRTAFENCLAAVDQCDLFLGILTGRYGSGQVEGQLSITHQEFARAIELNKPRWFLTHADVVFARRLLRDLGFATSEQRAALNLRSGAKSIEDVRVIDMYETAIRAHEPLNARTGNWVQEFRNDADALLFASAQFSRFQEAEAFLRENMNSPQSVMAQIAERRSERSGDDS
jgi:hypothetical protein